ncbi:hypothetical protein HF313_26020 [Massilia atriviolacea]|uniref:Uncharacterized protein n=1 Tax=Massilia atriviolacea TaxID=2495579 RepID=A0A430HMU4_9BURK|nr:hypothetical protein [Massilia atriviolacea]RSZ58878.1 hypothetical protein EJB06_11075 [Massilia atriviolacea]
MILNPNVPVSVQSANIGDTQQPVSDLLNKGDKELYQTYGEPASMKMLVNGDVERMWNIGAGTLHVTHDKNGKASDVKYFTRVTSDELESMSQKAQA